MKVNLDYKGKQLIIVYDDNGVLEHIINSETNEKMMIEFTQVGSGYEINNYVQMTICNAIHSRITEMDICNAVYVRIMEIDVYVPKFIFILNNK